MYHNVPMYHDVQPIWQMDRIYYRQWFYNVETRTMYWNLKYDHDNESFSIVELN